MMKKVRTAILLILFVFLLTGCGKNLFIDDMNENTEGVIKLGEKYVTVQVVRWKIKEERIKILTASGEVYDVLYKDVAIVDRDF